ncbi:MAG: glycosyltransferase [Phycisphaeraceae bacterium]|nr:glycosyltransferase [Phycisphaeraceae bacterium]
MRVVLVNWARVWDGAGIGGGVNGYAQALALELSDLGHEVWWICSGQTYIAGEPLHVRRQEDWLGVRVLEIINSPVMAPSIVQFKDPGAERSSPELEALFTRIIGWIEPDVVHFHNVEGLSAGCVKAASGVGRQQSRTAVVYSLHNYHTICPQVYLLQGHRHVCHNAEGGAACARCVQSPDPAETRRQREAEWLPTKAERPTLRAIREEIRSFVVRNNASDRAPGRVVQGQDDLIAPMGLHPNADTRGRTARVLAEREQQKNPSPTLRVLSNEITPDPSIESPVNEYGHRRRAMIDALNSCDAVLAVSDFVSSKFLSMGVRSEILRTQHIGTTLNRVVARRRSLAFAPPPFDPVRPRPIRMTFMGVNHWYKGLPFFLDTLETLDPETLAAFHLSIFAQGADQTEWMVRRLEPRLAGVRIQYGYDQADIPWILGGADLGLVPSVWWDNAPQTVFEFFACSVPVLASAVGGIPDFVKHGVNGMLFRSNDRDDLAAKLRLLAADRSILSSLRANVRPPKDIGEHARELVGVYAECVRIRGRDPIDAIRERDVPPMSSPGVTS